MRDLIDRGIDSIVDYADAAGETGRAFAYVFVGEEDGTPQPVTLDYSFEIAFTNASTINMLDTAFIAYGVKSGGKPSRISSYFTRTNNGCNKIRNHVAIWPQRDNKLGINRNGHKSISHHIRKNVGSRAFV